MPARVSSDVVSGETAEGAIVERIGGGKNGMIVVK